MPCSSHPEKMRVRKTKIKRDQIHCQKTLMVGGRSRRTAFVTGGGLGAFLLLLAIVSVPQKKTHSTATVLVAVTCVGKEQKD
jgi:hypothetical protein